MITGDLILSSGSSAFSKVIKEASGSQFSHLAMALHGKHIGQEGMWVWEATGRGVGEVPWDVSTHTPRTDFLTRTVNPGAGDVAIRELKWPSEGALFHAIERFLEHRDQVKGRPYETNKREMVNVMFPWLGPKIFGATDDDLSACFCWEAVAAAWRAMGLLPADRAANTYPVNEFLGEMSLGLGVTMGPLEKIVNPI